MLYRLSYMSTTPSNLERVAGIEPASSAWKAEVLPLNYTRYAHTKFLTNAVEGVDYSWLRHFGEPCGSNPPRSCPVSTTAPSKRVTPYLYLVEGGGLFGASPLTLRVADKRRSKWLRHFGEPCGSNPPRALSLLH